MLTDLCKLDKREYNAGRKNCQSLIDERGIEYVAGYLAAKTAHTDKWSPARVISYWAGYEDVLREVTL